MGTVSTHRMKLLFLLNQEIAYLNRGSSGACPRVEDGQALPAALKALLPT